MKSNSMTALTLYPFLRQIKILRSTATGVTKGIDATGRPFMDQPRRTVARGMRLRVMGAFSLRCKGDMALSFEGGRATAAQHHGINNVNPTWPLGCQFSSV
jgi:hypothetical protein